MGGAIVGASISILVGIVCLVIGIFNIKGNISMLHSYHINNITEENKLPFGRCIGVGMIIISLTLIIYGVLFIPAELTKETIYMTVGNIVLVIGLVIGIVICLYAVKKYNKNIFGK